MGLKPGNPLYLVDGGSVQIGSVIEAHNEPFNGALHSVMNKKNNSGGLFVKAPPLKGSLYTLKTESWEGYPKVEAGSAQGFEVNTVDFRGTISIIEVESGQLITRTGKRTFVL